MTVQMDTTGAKGAGAGNAPPLTAVDDMLTDVKPIVNHPWPDHNGRRTDSAGTGGARMEAEAGRRFAAWLQEQLDLRGWSQADLARASGASTAAVSKWIKNARLPGPASLDAIAAALTLDPKEVYKAAGVVEGLLEPRRAKPVPTPLPRREEPA